MDQLGRLNDTVPIAHETAAPNMRKAPSGAVSKTKRSGPTSTAKAEIPNTKEMTLFRVNGSCSTKLLMIEAQTGMVNAMITARPAGMCETP